MLLTPGCRLAGLEILRDLVERANGYGARLYEDVEAVRTASIALLSQDGRPVLAADRRRVPVDGALADARIDALYIPEFVFEPAGWTERLRLAEPELAVLRRVGRSVVVTACVGSAVLLAVEAGLTSAGPVSAHRSLVSPLRRGRRISIDPTTTVVEAPGLLTTSGLAGEASLGLRLIEMLITPHLARVLAREIGAPMTSTAAIADPFAVNTLQADDLVIRACEAIKAAFSRPIDLKAFAASLGVSPRTLTRRFQTSIGMGPKAYQQHLRLASAQTMLIRTTRPVARIAAMVGYADPAFFVGLFKARVGETPSAFRRRGRASSHP